MTQEHAALQFYQEAEGHILYLSQKARSFRIFDRLGRFSVSQKCRTTTVVLTGEAMTVGEAAAAMEATATATTAMAVETATVAEIAMAVEEALVDTESKSKFHCVENKGKCFLCFVFEYVLNRDKFVDLVFSVLS